jgi:hypothetical protein
MLLNKQNKAERESRKRKNRFESNLAAEIYAAEYNRAVRNGNAKLGKWNVWIKVEFAIEGNCNLANVSLIGAVLIKKSRGRG